jgi:DoxX-like family
MSTNMSEWGGGRAATDSARKGIRVAARVATGLFVAIMTLSGILYVIGPKPIIAAMSELGYPLYLLKLLGIAKLLGVVGLVVPDRPRLREWAYAGFTFDLVGAIVSHLATGGVSHVAPALVLLVIMTLSYVLQRRLGAAPSLAGIRGGSK